MCRFGHLFSVLLGFPLLIAGLGPVAAQPPGNVAVGPNTIRMDLERDAEVSVSWEHRFSDDDGVTYYRICATASGSCDLSDDANLVINVEAGKSETRLRLAAAKFQGQEIQVIVSACSGSIAASCDSAVSKLVRWVPPPPDGRREINTPTAGVPSSVIWLPVTGASDYLVCLGRDKLRCPSEPTAPSAEPVVIQTRRTMEDVLTRRFPQFHGGQLNWTVASCSKFGGQRVCGAYATPQRRVKIPKL